MYVQDGVREILNDLETGISDDSTEQELRTLIDNAIEKLRDEVEELDKYAQWKIDCISML